MTALAFDTHAIARRYKAAGFTDAQVEAMVDTAREAASLPELSHLATKADVVELRAELRGDIAGLKQQVAESKVQFIMATLAIVGFADGLLFFLLRK